MLHFFDVPIKRLSTVANCDSRKQLHVHCVPAFGTKTGTCFISNSLVCSQRLKIQHVLSSAEAGLQKFSSDLRIHHKHYDLSSYKALESKECRLAKFNFCQKMWSIIIASSSISDWIDWWFRPQQPWTDRKCQIGNCSNDLRWTVQRACPWNDPGRSMCLPFKVKLIFFFQAQISSLSLDLSTKTPKMIQKSTYVTVLVGIVVRNRKR